MKSDIAILSMPRWLSIEQKVFELSIVAYSQASLVSYMSLCNSLFTRNSNYCRVSVIDQRSETHLTEGIVFPEKDPDVPLNNSRILLCSAIAKMTASVTTYPHEVVRTRLQTQRRPLADDASSDGMVKAHVRRGAIYITRKIIVKEGWTALYKGLSINLIRTVPNSAVTMLTCVLCLCPVAQTDITFHIRQLWTTDETAQLTDIIPTN